MALPNQPIVSPLLVGRARESEYLEQALAAARQGRGAMVLLAGEAGLGKSRLARESHATAVRDGFDVLVGHCFEDDAGFAYAPIIDTLPRLVCPASRSHGGDSARRAGGGRGQATARTGAYRPGHAAAGSARR